MEVNSTRSTGESIRKRGKQYHKVRYVGVPIIVLGSRLSRPTEAKVWSTGGDTAFVLVVLTTNHIRNKVDLEVKTNCRPIV